MEKSSASLTVDVESQRSAAQHGGGLPTVDDAGNVDEPPIPSGSSSTLINEKALDGAPCMLNETNTTSSITTADEKDEEVAPGHAHSLTYQQVASRLGTDSQYGLDTDEVARRRLQHGYNRLEKSGSITPWTILIRQIANSLTIVLVIAMVISFAILDFIEGGVIAAIIVLNICVGFYQDFRAEQTIASLMAMAAPVCKVIRDSGNLLSVKAEDLVPGDIVALAVGDIVPADLRLFNSINLASDEAALTGESKAVIKDAEYLSDRPDEPIGDRLNIAYSSTTITRGRGIGIVVATGMRTEIGKIALLLQDKRPDSEGPLALRVVKKVLYGIKNGLGLVGTPLQVKLSWFALFLFGLAILLAIIVFSVNLWDVDDETLIYGICVAVAVIPESLIAVLTITMAVGSKAMSQGHVVVRKMGALEAIGGVTNICSDKTGTLTRGKMLARKALLPDGRLIKVENESNPLDPTAGHLTLDDSKVGTTDVWSDLPVRRFFEVIALCNISSVKAPQDPEDGWTATGEPTEIALNVMAMRVGCGKTNMTAKGMRLLAEHSFDSAIKRMTAVYVDESSNETLCFTKGATEVLLPLMDIDEATSRSILTHAEAMASEGLRVLCLASRRLSPDDATKVNDREYVESQLRFTGLVGIYDPPRQESAGAILQCQGAGITVHMLTGDHLKTAQTIAHEIGILGPNVPGSSSSTAVMTASTFDSLSDTELDQMSTLPLVLARCSPTTKLRMLDALHRRNNFCVMTGDGVNDSPALKGADVGVAMGINGSDVSKEAADMVLTDDNFASIVAAIKEGRRLFDNIRKFLLHLLVSNIAQVILLLIGLAFKDRHDVSVFPLSPLEILFANLVSSSFLAIGLGLEEASADVMARPPTRNGVFTRELLVDKFVYGTCMGVLCLASFVVVAYGVGDGDLGFDCNHSYNSSCDLAYRARGTAYAILTVLLSVMALEAKHFDKSLFNMYPGERDDAPRGLSVLSTIRRNRFLFWAVAAGLVTPFPIIYVPVVNRVVFRHMPLTWEWGLVFGSIVVFVSAVESWKAIKRRFKGKRDGGSGV